MKEAAGEANLTVVAIILIAIIVAIATPLIASLMRSSSARACCTDAGGRWANNQCQAFQNAAAGQQFDPASFQRCMNESQAGQ